MTTPDTIELRQAIAKELKFWRKRELKDIYYPLDIIMELVSAERQRWETAARKETAVYVASMTHCPLGTTCSAHKTHDLAEFLAELEAGSGEANQGDLENHSETAS